MKSILKRALIGTYALTASGFAAAQATDNAAAPAADPNSAAAPAPDSSAAPESSTPGSERAAPHDRFMQEVVVTAQKREENLQDVPVAVSAFSAENLEARGVDDPKALERITPGMSYSSLVGYSLIYLRGVGTDNFIPSADTSVATYIDGVYLPFAHSLAQSFVPLERIEIEKGPQGTLFGRNSTGGAINIVTKKPSDTLEGNFSVSRGNFNAMTAKGFVSGPLGLPGLTGSVSFIYDQIDPYYKTVPDSVVKAQAGNFTRGMSAKLRYQPIDEFTIKANTLISGFDGSGTIANQNPNVKPLGSLLGIQPTTGYEISSDRRNFLSAHNLLVYGEADWNPELFDMKLLSSYQKVRTNTDFDYDGSSQNIVGFLPTNQYFRDTTDELQFLSKKGGLFPDWMSLTSGLYYFRSSGGFDPVYFQAVDLTHLSSLPIPPILQPLTGALQPLYNAVENLGTQFSNRFGVPFPVNGADIVLHGVVWTRSYAAYAQTTITPFKWFDVTLGARYQTEDRGVSQSSSALQTTTGPINIFQFPHDKAVTYNFSPKVTLDFKPFDDQLIYMTWQKGYKSGTFNVLSIYTPPTYVKPEKVTAVELGNKGSFFDGNLRYSAALFQSRINDLQTLIVSLVSGGAVNLANAGEATIRGAEFDVTARPLPELLSGLNVNVSGAYLHGVYNSFPNGPGFDQTTGLYFGPNSLTATPGRDFSGNKTVRTPKFTAAIAPGYTFNAPGGSVELGADGYYNSGFFYDTQNTVKQPNYFTVGMHTSYLYDPWQLRITAYGKNINGSYYFTNKFATDFGVAAKPAPPAEYGLRLNWDF